MVCRSALTLKLLTFCQSGAVTAAATTSLPEWFGGARNWDYRYCWLRDAGMTAQALVGLGYMEEAEYFLGWLLHATRLTWPKLQVVYDIYGHATLKERELTHLRGFRNSRPVRIGNAASEQQQLDVYGEILSAAAAFVAGGGQLSDSEKRMLRGFGLTVVAEWEKPDHGIWEVRGPKRHYTFSKMMCWLALDRLKAMEDAGILSLGKDRSKLEAARDAIAAAIETRGYNEDLNAYVDAFDGKGLDASLLLMSCIGYRDADHPRMRATYQRIWETLGRGDLVYRYGERFDGLPGREGAFVMLSFWAVQNLAARGELDAAEALFERLLRYGNDLGLFPEEVDPESGIALGNTPQAFSHTALINAALAIAAARDKTHAGGAL